MDSEGAERKIGRDRDGFATPHGAGGAFYFDFVDPVSYVVAHIIDRADAAALFDWRAFELRPPPGGLIDPGGHAWRGRHAHALALAETTVAAQPSGPALLPWTRKAHELCEFAQEMGSAHRVRRALFRAHFVDHADIGRIDSLVDIAGRAGLDRTETRVVLDVDRYAGVVLRNREAALARGIADVPAFVSTTGSLVDSSTLSEIMSLIERYTQDNQ